MPRRRRLLATAALPLAGTLGSFTLPTPSNPAAVIAMTAGAQSPTVESLSCTARLDCTAVGSYLIGGAQRAMAVTEESGHWLRAVSVGAASSAATTLASVSCVDAVNCTAVGWIESKDNERAPIAVTETNGRWGAVARLALLASAPGPTFENLLSVSCSDIRHCSAVGDYLDAQGVEMPIADVEQNGKWDRPQVLVPPVDAGRLGDEPLARLVAVSCTAPGSCTAVGSYTTAASVREAMAFDERGERWGRASEIVGAPAGALQRSGELTAISCGAVQNCTAVGDALSASGNLVPQVVNESSGHWQRANAVEIGTAAGAANGEFVSVSCGYLANCTTVGSYVDTTDNSEPMVALRTAGVWGPGFNGVVPNGGISAGAELNAVSCVEGGCTAVGEYFNRSLAQELMAVALPT